MVGFHATSYTREKEAFLKDGYCWLHFFVKPILKTLGLFNNVAYQSGGYVLEFPTIKFPSYFATQLLVAYHYFIFLSFIYSQLDLFHRITFVRHLRYISFVWRHFGIDEGVRIWCGYV
jgi:hypothetical protein